MEPCEPQRKEYEQCLHFFKSNDEVYKLLFCREKQRSFVWCNEFDKWLLQTVTKQTNTNTNTNGGKQN